MVYAPERISTPINPVLGDRGSGRTILKLYLTSDAAKLAHNQGLRHVAEAVHKTQNLKMDLDVLVAWEDIQGRDRSRVFTKLLAQRGYPEWAVVERPIRVTPDVF